MNFEQSEHRTNERGNLVIEGSDFGGDRYRYDFEDCSSKNGWQQWDTDQDASYFGVWVHPEKRCTFTYAEGDTILVICPTAESFKAELQNLVDFYGSEQKPAFVVIGEEGVTQYYDKRYTGENL